MKSLVKKGAIIFYVFLLLAAMFIFMPISSFSMPIGNAIKAISSNCISGTYSCSDDNTLMYCEVGKWVVYKRCPNGCKENVCISGSGCGVGQLQCNNNYIQECRQGSWVNKERCPTECSDGICVVGKYCKEGETQCNNDYMQDCKYGVWVNKARCSQGCKNGLCVEFKDKKNCKESDDGMDFTVKGTTKGVDMFNEEYEFIDKCLDDKMLLEHYCRGDEYAERKHVCEGTCKDGVCLPVEEEPVVEDEIVVEIPEPVVEETTVVEEEKPGFFGAIWAWMKGLF